MQERDGISIAIINIYCKYENKAEKKKWKIYNHNNLCTAKYVARKSRIIIDTDMKYKRCVFLWVYQRVY